jgi:hypothetical protein
VPNTPFSLPLQLSTGALLIAFAVVFLALLPDAEALTQLPIRRAGALAWVGVAVFAQLFLAVESGWLLRPLRLGSGSLAGTL